MHVCVWCAGGREGGGATTAAAAAAAHATHPARAGPPSCVFQRKHVHLKLGFLLLTHTNTNANVLWLAPHQLEEYREHPFSWGR